MKWAFKIGRFAGIDVFIHATFLLLIGWVALIHWQHGQSFAAVASGVVFILAVFLCVTLHEYGHALTARRYGVKTKDIVLLPIGGVARLERLPTRPSEELFVALAGPAVNVVIAILLWLWLRVSGTMAPMSELTVTTGPFLERIMAVNLFLALFNMIPAFPMDGGRVLRSLLAVRMGHAPATRIAASVGQGLAYVFGFIGLVYQPMLLFIAFFVWIGAAQEASLAHMRSAAGGISVEQVMQTDFRTLSPDDSLAHAAELTLAGSQKDFPVVNGMGILGVLTQTRLLATLNREGGNPPVSSAMETHFTTVNALDTLETAFARLEDCRCRSLPVVKEGRLVGILTMENVGEFLRIQSALGRSNTSLHQESA